jgi:peptide/nickel transport system permease protein
MVVVLLKKVGYGLLVLLGVITIVFFLFHSITSNPVAMITGQQADAKTIANIKKEYDLDKPLWQQYVLYVNDVMPLSIYKDSTITQKKLQGIFAGGSIKVGLKWPYLRRSFQSKKEVSSLLAEMFIGTVVLAIAAMCIAIVFGIGLGIIAAIKKDTWIDNTSLVTSVAGISAPSFFIAILLAYVFGFVLHKYTGLQMTGSLFTYDGNGKHIALQNLILPAVTLGIRPMAIIMQLTRSSMLDTLQMDFVRTARAKGLSRKRVILQHALPNALNPVITAITGWFAELLAGSFFVEYIFGWKGLGKVTVDALEKQDFPIVMGSIIFAATIFIVMNIITDALYKWLDPRIKT